MAADREREFREFVAGRSAALLRTAYLLTGDRGHAEDLLQTALTSTYVAWNRIADPGAVEAYTRRAMVNARRSWWRRRSNREQPTAAPAHGVLPDPTADVDERDEMLAALATLPARQRAVVVLRYYDDLTEAQTAELLGCSVGTVKSQCADALRKLRERYAVPATKGRQR